MMILIRTHICESNNKEMNDEENRLNGKIMQKLVEIVEKYSERIVFLENMITKDVKPIDLEITQMK